MDCSNNELCIRHLVIAGGGLTGFSYYGALKESCRQGEWKLSNIQSIYGCSYGAFLSVLIALGYDWDDIDNYLIKRPWQNVFKYDIYSLFDSITNKGFFSVKTFDSVMSPLLLGKDLDINITLGEFYQYTHIDIHMFTTDVHQFQQIDLSHKTHPDWRVIDAIYSSCAIPIIFAPLKQGYSYFYDGAFFSNYPVEECVKNGAKPSEILGISGTFNTAEKQTITTDSSMLDCITVLLGNIIHTVLQCKPIDGIHTEYFVETTTLTLSSMYNTALDKNERSRLIDIGIDLVRENKRIDASLCSSNPSNHSTSL